MIDQLTDLLPQSQPRSLRLCIATWITFPAVQCDWEIIILLLKGFILASVVHHCRNGTYGKDATSILRQMGFTTYVGLVGLVCSPSQLSCSELWTESERNSSLYISSKPVHSFLLSALFHSDAFALWNMSSCSTLNQKRKYNVRCT